MTVISVAVIESDEQIISGVPRFISIVSNDPSATIFYTLDGSTPSTLSTIYTGQFALPTNQLIVTLNILAIDGDFASPILTYVFQSTFVNGDIRFPHSGTDAPVNAPPTNDPYPFGDFPYPYPSNFTGVASAGYTTDDPALPQTSSGFNAFGQPDGYTNETPIGVPTKSLPVIYSESDREGIQGPGIGTVPQSTIVPSKPIPEQSTVGSPLFDPRALVVYQDLTKPQDPGLPPFIHREHFTLEDVDHVRQGNQYFNTALDSPPVSGTFLRQHYNPTDNTMNYYYLDTWQNRWIITKTPAPNNPINNYSSNVVASGNGAGFVFQWVLFKANYLY